jgi:hypothetical protein
MAKKDEGNEIVPGQIYEGHGDNTQPAGIQSPATFAPLSQEPKSVNQKTESGKKGKES